MNDENIRVKKSAFYIWLAIGIIAVLSGCSKQEKEVESAVFDEYVEYLLNNEDSSYDSSKVEKYNNNQEIKDILESEEYITDPRVNFVKGMEQYASDNTSNAINYLENSIKECDYDKNPKIVIRSLEELIHAYYYENDINTSLMYFNEFIELYDNDPHNEYFVTAVRWLTSGVYELPCSDEEKMNLLLNTRERAQEIEHPNTAEIIYKLSKCYEEKGESTKYMETLIEALKCSEEVKNDYLTMFISVDVANCYSYREDYDKAIQYLMDIDTMHLEDIGLESEMKAYAKSTLAYIYYELEDYEKAYECALQAREYIALENEDYIKQDDEINNKVMIAQMGLALGHTEDAKVLLDEAKAAYEKKLKFSYIGFDITLETAYGKYYEAINEDEEALKHYLNSFELSEEYGFNYDCAVSIFMLYERLGDYKKAYEYLYSAHEYMQNKYETFAEEKSSYLMEEFQSEKKAQEIQHLKERNNHITLMISILATFTVLIIVCIFIIVRKNSELANVNGILKNLSEIDVLTGISNRRALDEYINLERNEIHEENKPLTIAMLDVDYFKNYNDNYGHQAGDEVLNKVGKYLIEQKRANDFTARYGGEEFIVIMPHTDERKAFTLLESLRKGVYSFNLKHEYSAVSDKVTVSIGFATAVMGEEVGYKELISRADRALYNAKQKRNMVEKYIGDTE